MKIPAQGLIGREALREAAAQPDLRAVMDLVRAAIVTALSLANPTNQNKWFDVEAFYADRMVIELDGRCWSYPYTIAGTAVAVRYAYHDVVVSAGTPISFSLANTLTLAAR